MGQTHSPGLSSVAIRTALFIVASCALCYWNIAIAPIITPLSYTLESPPNQPSQKLSLPLWYHEEQVTALVSIHLKNKTFFPTQYEFFADDCIESIWVNGNAINETTPLFCDHQFGRTYDLSPFLNSGINTLDVRVKNWGSRGDFYVQVARIDRQILSIRVLLIILCFWYGLFLIRTYCRNENHRLLYVIFLIGSILRLIYFFATPFGVRSHDVVGHLEYIRYFDEMRSIPHFKTSWTFHHPPLYYFLSAVWLTLGRVFDLSSKSLIYFLQYQSLIFSIATLAVGCWIATICFSEKNQLIQRLVSAGLFAVFPGFVYFAARINNDVLFQLGAFLSTALLLVWWKQPTSRNWIIANIVLALSLLTKASALLFIAWAYLLLIITVRTNIQLLLRRGFESVSVLLLIAGWFFYHRYVVQGQHSVDPTFTTSHKSLIIENTIVNFLTFNPVKVLEFTYNNPWGDVERRMFFWEYLYRSAFVGEFNFGKHLLWICSYLLLVGMHLLPLIIYGIRKERYRERSAGLPLIILLAMSISALISLRLQYPASSAQDFRFIFFSLIPCAYFLARSLGDLSEKWRNISLTFVASFFVACLIFITLLYHYPTPNKFEREDMQLYHSWKT